MLRARCCSSGAVKAVPTPVLAAIAAATRSLPKYFCASAFCPSKFARIVSASTSALPPGLYWSNVWPMDC